jgi:hypothetical protein
MEIVWVSPMFGSLQIDKSYGISNYEEVHTPYGTVQVGATVPDPRFESQAKATEVCSSPYEDAT